MIGKNKYSLISKGKISIAFSFLIASVLLFQGCTEDDLLGDFDNEDWSDILRVKAKIEPSADTRGDYYFGKEAVNPIVNGTFYLTYPRNENNFSTTSAQYDTAIVKFGEGEDPTVAFAYYEKDGEKKDLKWKKIAQQGTKDAYFFLHNIDPSVVTFPSDNTYTKQKYTFKQDVNPYVASRLDKDKGTNDLIVSGGDTPDASNYILANAQTGQLEFNLYHRMALLDLNIEVFNSEGDDHLVSLDNAEVTITKLYTKLKSLNIYYCRDSYFTTSNSYDSNNCYSDQQPVKLIDPEGNPDEWGWEKFIDEETGKDLPYKKGEHKEGNYIFQKHTYKVPDYIFPPQTLDTENNRPEVIIKVPKKDVTGSTSDTGIVEYRGFLPPVMYNTDPEMSQNPITTKLNSGYILHVTASINSPSTELTFTPVKVEQWVDKGIFTVNTQKAGIYNRNDLNKLIETYNNKDLTYEQKAYELEKFGFVSDGLFIFQLWGNFSVDKNEIENKIELDENYRFIFILNDYSLTVNNGDDEDSDTEPGQQEILKGSSGEERLYEILTGETFKLYNGIQTEDDLLDFLSLCKASDNYTTPSTKKLMKYGYLNSYDNCWDFCLEQDIYVNVEDIQGMIDKSFLQNDYNLDMNNHSIFVKIGEKYLECKQEDGYNYFITLAEERPGKALYNAPDFYLLRELYNNYYLENKDLLEMFGTKSIYTNGNESWTFTFQKTMTLNGDIAYSSMIPDVENGKPSYSLSTTPSQGVTIYFQGSYFSMQISNGSSQKRYIFDGSGGPNGATPLDAVITNYNNKSYINLFQRGRFIDGKWIFPLTYSSSQSANYDGIFGEMIPDPDNGKCDYEFELKDKRIAVNNMPDFEGSTETSTHYFYQDNTDTFPYPNSAQDLKKLTLGTYWEDN